MASRLFTNKSEHELVEIHLKSEVNRITNGRPELYSRETIKEIEKDVLDELEANKKTYYNLKYPKISFIISGFVLLVLSVITFVLQTIAISSNDLTCSYFGGYMY